MGCALGLGFAPSFWAKAEPGVQPKLDEILYGEA
jgi:hypothetical protein